MGDRNGRGETGLKVIEKDLAGNGGPWSQGRSVWAMPFGGHRTPAGWMAMGWRVVACLGKGKNERSSLQLDHTKTQHLVSSPSFLLYPEGKVGKWEKFISKYSNFHSDSLSSRGVGMSAFSHGTDGSQGSSGWSISVEEGSGEVSQALDHVWSPRAVG